MMRERLIELLSEAFIKSNDNYGMPYAGQVADLLLANGVIVSPCNVGDVVYPLNADKRFRAFIEKIEITADGLGFEWAQYDVGVDCVETWDDGFFTLDEIGKTVFLTEAERALKEREQG